MTKRSPEVTPALIESEFEELPLKKRFKIQADHDVSNSVPPLIKLVAAALAELPGVGTSKRSAEADHIPKLPKVVGCPSLRPTALPSTSFKPMPARRVVTSSNYCTSGKPLACPPMLLKKDLHSKFVLQKIDSTLQ